VTLRPGSPWIKGSAFVPHDLKVPLKGADAGPLAGLTCAIKDMYDIAGEVTGGGNPAWRESHLAATTNAAAIQRVLDAGAAIIGKTVCDEFFFSVLGINPHYPTPVNPRTPDRIPGGSSSGAAVAVASGAADFALGSDTGGSVRIPAMVNGIYGIRPTVGRVSLQGAMLMAETFDVCGWFTSGPGLLRQIGYVLLEGEAVAAPVMRVVSAKDLIALADPAVRAAFTRFVARFADTLPRPADIEIGPEGFDDWRETFRVIQAFEIWQVYGAWLDSHDAELGPGTKERFAYAKTVSAETVGAARRRMAEIRAHIHALLPPGTVLIIPTAPAVGPLLTASAADLNAYRTRAMDYTCIAGLGGLPQINIPAGSIDGVPFGVSLIGWPGADETLLDLTVALSRFCGD
jgi:amidase